MFVSSLLNLVGCHLTQMTAQYDTELRKIP